MTPATIMLDHSTLRVYLRDHLAASVAAIRLLQRMCDGKVAPPLGDELVGITRDVRAEQELLRTLLRSVGGRERGPAVALAWLGERLTRLKLGPGNRGDSGLKLFETLEALALAFYGRHSLWLTMAELGDETPLGRDVDFRSLATRAERHLQLMEQARVEASHRALRLHPDP